MEATENNTKKWNNDIFHNYFDLASTSQQSITSEKGLKIEISKGGGSDRGLIKSFFNPTFNFRIGDQNHRKLFGLGKG